MARVSLGMVALVAVSACGQTERDHSTPSTMGGAVTSIGGSGAGMGSASGSAHAGVGGLAGVGGVAGASGSAQVQSAVLECERYCETLEYKLPGALCEDWNRPGWEPPFCHLAPTTSCADYCGKVYEAVSPTCAALLQPVIRCVAPYYTNVALTPCWLADCRDQLFTMTSACYGLQEQLVAARATWQASGVVDYDLTYAWRDDVKAKVVVRGGDEPVVTPADATAWTVPKLFDEVERYLHQPGVSPNALYDANLGYVVDLAYQEGCTEGSAVISSTELTPLR